MKRITFFLYQIYAWLVFIPFGIVFSFIAGWMTVLAAILFSPKIANRYVAASWGRVLGWLTPMWVSVEGAEHIDPDKSYVVVCNHQSQYDIFLVYGWLKLDLKWVIKAELRKVPGIGIGCEKAGHIFVERGNPEQTSKAVGAALDGVGDGVGILFFAEGTRSLDGNLLPFKKGAFRIAIAQRLPILPVTIVGTRAIQPPKSIWIFPGRARLIIHPAIETENVEAQDIRDLMTRTRDVIASALPSRVDTTLGPNHAPE